MKKVLLFGDYLHHTWHGLKGVDDQLSDILSDYEIRIVPDYAHLTAADFSGIDLVIDYIDGWSKTGNCDIAGELLAYVASGGSVLSIHNGIIKRTSPDYEQMLGGRFLGHPPAEVLSYTSLSNHPLSKGLPPFEIFEEPYQLELSNLASLTMLVEYEYHGQKYPAAWLRPFGKGKVVYLCPGHNAESFRVEGFRELIRRSAAWCVGDR